MLVGLVLSKRHGLTISRSIEACAHVFTSVARNGSGFSRTAGATAHFPGLYSDSSLAEPHTGVWAAGVWSSVLDLLGS